MAWVKLKGKINGTVEDYHVLADATWDFSDCAMASGYTAASNHWYIRESDGRLMWTAPTTAARSNCASTELINMKPYKVLTIRYVADGTTYTKTLDVSNYNGYYMICLIGYCDSNSTTKRACLTLSPSRTYPYTKNVVLRRFPNFTESAQTCSNIGIFGLVLSASEVATTSLETEE